LIRWATLRDDHDAELKVQKNKMFIFEVIPYGQPLGGIPMRKAQYPRREKGETFMGPKAIFSMKKRLGNQRGPATPLKPPHFKIDHKPRVGPIIAGGKRTSMNQFTPAG